MSRKCRILQGGYCEITQGYSQNHRGIDIVGKDYTLTNILAHTDGIVVSCRTDCKGFEGNGSYGNYVKIKHNDGYYTLYAHMAYGTVKVRNGSKVKRGDILGFMGATGEAYGGHLHWEVRNPSDVRINPTPYLDKDLPSSSIDYTGVITYQAYTNFWLPEVHKCDDTADGYAGIGNEYITAFRCKPQYGDITYQVKLSNGEWLPSVSSKDYDDNSYNSYAGILGKPIDLVKIKSSKGWVKYQVKTKEDGWLPMVDSRTETGTESYAGIENHNIIGIRMY